MSGETVLLSAMPRDSGYRIKRVKREEALTTKQMVQDVRVSKQFLNSHTRCYPIRDSSSPESDGQRTSDNSRPHINALHVHAASQTATITRSTLYPEKSVERELPISPQSQSQSSNISNKRRRSCSAVMGIDLSHIPSDPHSLRMWLAQQISHSQSTEPVRQSRGSSSPSAEMDITSGSDAYSNKRPRLSRSQTQRTRKPSNKIHEETILNKNQCHRKTNSTSRATPSKHLTRDNLKISADQGVRQQNDNKVPNYKVKTDIDHNLFAAQNIELRPEVREIGALAIGTLFPVNHGSHAECQSESADALYTTLKRPGFNAQFLVEALKILAHHTNVLLAIQGVASRDRSSTAKTVDNSETRSMWSPEEDTAQPTLYATQQLDEIIRALNGATALLNEMADNKEYVTPYANPPHRNSAFNGVGPQTEISSSSAATGFVFDNAQIDAVLALANGGSLTDDEDDQTIADPDEFDEQLPDPLDMVDGDIDIAMILNHVINQFKATRKASQSLNDLHGSSTRDLNGPPSIAEQSTSLQSMFKKASVSVNTIVPLAQSYATSQFYAHLSTHAHSFTSSGRVNPADSDVHGKSLQTNYGLVPPHHGVKNNPHYPSNQSLGPSTCCLRGEIGDSPLVGIPPKMMDPEVQRKIAIYGCPPFPGSRIVSKSH